VTEHPDRTAQQGRADEVKQDEARGTPQVRSAQVADGAETPTADQG
jgi:hypothetical protein